MATQQLFGSKSATASERRCNSLTHEAFARPLYCGIWTEIGDTAAEVPSSDPKPIRLFISYAHYDGAHLAEWLRVQLLSRGFEVWMDVKRIDGGDRWAREIEGAIDNCDATVALLSEGAFRSDVCRAEQERSLAKGKLVIPVCIQPNCDVPLPLQARHRIDFSDPSSHLEALEQLVAASRSPREVSERGVRRVFHNNAPPLPERYIGRPEMIGIVRDNLFVGTTTRNLVLTAVSGMAGIGKTVLAQALCHDEVVQHAYPDGIFWVTIGAESALSFEQRIGTVPALKRMLGPYDGSAACISAYREAIREKSVLIGTGRCMAAERRRAVHCRVAAVTAAVNYPGSIDCGFSLRSGDHCRRFRRSIFASTACGVGRA